MTNEEKIEEIKKQLSNLEAENKAHNKVIFDNCDKIKDLEKQLEILKFGKQPNCRDCRYSIGLDFSPDGWHNLCGNEDATRCTCCNDFCDRFKPDSELTAYIKEHCDAHISGDDAEGLKELGVGPYMDYDKMGPERLTEIKEFYKAYLMFIEHTWND